MDRCRGQGVSWIGVGRLNKTTTPRQVGGMKRGIGRHGTANRLCCFLLNSAGTVLAETAAAIRPKMGG